MPTPLEELGLHVVAKAREEMQTSNRFPNYDFERHTGNLAIVRDPQFFIEPIHETSKQKLVEFAPNAARARQDRYYVRGEAYRNRSHIDLIHAHNYPMMLITQQRRSSSAEDEAEQSRRRMSCV